MTSFSSFADLGQHLVAERASRATLDDGVAETYDERFIEQSELAKMHFVEEAEKLDMPDPQACATAIEMVAGTIFDVLRDSRMEEFGQQIVWGIVNSFHMTARMAEGREDDAAKKLAELARNFDPSEIYAVELEETQLLCQTLQGCREALEAMRDHASKVYHVETGRPFIATRGSQIARTGVTASQISARDYLAAKASKRRQEFAPEGPIVVVSGGMEWHDHELLWDTLDGIKERTPHMVLATTGMRKGVDAAASAWAVSRKVHHVAFVPDRRLGQRAAFVRNENLVKLQPVEAIVCEGSGIQANLAQRLRQANVPLHVYRVAEQRALARRR